MPPRAATHTGCVTRGGAGKQKPSTAADSTPGREGVKPHSWRLTCERDQEQLLPRRVFADLPRVHQEVLRLRFVEELDHAAIAARLQTTEHAARQRVYRAMQALRALTRQHQLGELGLDGS